MNRKEMIQKYVDLKVELHEKESTFRKYFGEGSVAEDIIDTLDMFIINEMLGIDGEETESDFLFMDFIDWKQTGSKHSEIHHPETYKLINNVEDLMPLLYFKD